MATTSTRQWKGCPMCKFHKYKHYGHAVRKPWAELRKLGKDKRVSRHDLGFDNE